MHINKEKVLIHFENTVDYVKKLSHITEEQWRTPIAKDKWTVAEIIGHLTPWDEFLYNNRIPYLFNNSPLPKEPNEEELNRQSAYISRKQSKDETILKFINGRRNLIITINNLADDLWEKEIIIGNNTLTLYQYFLDFIEHDIHHFNQINNCLGISTS